MDIRNIVILTGAGYQRRKRPRDLSRGRRPVGGASGRGCRDARGLRARSGAGPPFYDARRARLGEVEPNAAHRRAGAARCRMAGRVAARHAECRRSARARRGEAAAPHAWRADQRLVPGLRRALRLGRADGRGRDVPVLRRARPGPPRHRLVRRDALRDGADRRGAAAMPTCSCRSARRARSIPPPGSSRPRAIAARRRWRSTSSRARAASSSTRAAIGPASDQVPEWVEEVLLG